MLRIVAAAVVMTAGTAVAEERWETISTEPFLIKTRDVKGSAIKEIWAEGEVSAPVQDIQAALLDPDAFHRFMPYVKESRALGKMDGSGSQMVYTRLDFGAFVSSRDYVVRVTVEKSVGEDGTGEFKNHWVAVPDHLPSRANVIRLRVNQGTWEVVPRGPNKSFVVYRFIVDPGGWIPSFAANAGNNKGVTDTLRSVEREAQRRAELRRKSNETASVDVAVNAIQAPPTTVRD